MLIKTFNTGWTLWATMILISLFYQSSTYAQAGDNAQQRQTDDEIIEGFASSKVLNILMPKTLELNSEITFALTVRVEPSFEEEFQYIFIKRRSGEIELIKKRSASGNIYYKIVGIQEQTTVLTPLEMAKLIHILETRTHISPVKFKQLTEALDTAVLEHERREAARRADEERRRKAGEFVGSLMRDGTRYVIWMNGEKKCDVSMQGHSYKSPAQKDESPIIAWVRNLVKEL